MTYNFDKNAHSVYCLHYHFVQCIKYRRKVFYFPEIIKGATSKVLQNRFHKEIKHLLWSNIFPVIGQTTLDQVKKYVENQGENNATYSTTKN
jgi:REP element-mobilizing transposase RayT